MKLLNKTIRYYALISLPLLAIACVVSYWLIKSELRDGTDESLMREYIKAKELIQKTPMKEKKRGKTEALPSIIKKSNFRKEKSKNRYRSTVKARLGYLLASAKSRTKNTNMEFDIDLDFLCNLYKKQQGLCFYSKRKMLLEIGKWAISIDRRDSNKGYNKDNIVLVCWFVNNMKNNIQEIEFINICTEIVNNVNNTRLQFMWS